MKNTTRLMGVARLCLAAHPQLRMSQLLLLLLLLAVAEKPGRTQSELAAEVSQSVQYDVLLSEPKAAIQSV